MGWPFAALEFFAGGVGPQRLVKAAKASGHRDQLCEAYFFLGENALIRRSTADAMRFFADAHAMCRASADFYTVASAELKRLTKGHDDHAALARSSRN